MEDSRMKNMVVLKNLPSNLVEEAIVILKSSKKVKKLQKIEKKTHIPEEKNIKREKDYIIKEAEMLVSSYISRLESSCEQKHYRNLKASKKYKRLKKYAYLSSSIIVLEAIILFFK